MSEDRDQFVAEEELDLDAGEEAEEGADAEDGEGIEGSDGQQDEADGDAGDAEDEQEERPARSVSRRAGRSERYREQLREERAERQRLAARLEALERRPAPQIDPLEQQRREQAELERISMLPPNEQIMELDRRATQRSFALVQAQEQRFADQLDRQSYRELTRSDATARRLEQQVEGLRRENPTVAREVILNYLVGQEVRQKAAQATTRQRRQGRQAIRRETARPGNARSTEGRQSGRDDQAAYRKRLESYTF